MAKTVKLRTTVYLLVTDNILPNGKQFIQVSHNRLSFKALQKMYNTSLRNSTIRS